MSHSDPRRSFFGAILLLLLAAVVLFAACSPVSSNPSTETARQGNQPSAAAGEVDCQKVSLSNPAASYCSMLGYTYTRTTDAAGNSIGVCMFPDGSSCPQWDFYAGKCGHDFSYCAKNGYGTTTGTDGNDPYSSQYSICVDAQGKVIGSATRLSGLADAIDTCR